jgi:hypothetical protein
MNRKIILLLILSFLTKSCNSQNAENIYNGIDLTFSNPYFNKTLAQNQNIYWLGEQHGTKENYNVAFKMVSYLLKNENLDYLIIENSYLTEILLNKYLETGDTIVLNQSIRNYKNVYYSNNELRDYLIKIQDLYKKTPKNKKFRFVSIDLEQTFLPSKEYINLFLSQNEKAKEFNSIPKIAKLIKNNNWLDYYSKLSNYVDNDTIKYMSNNLIKLLFTYKNGERWDKVRDSLMYKNFKERNITFDFKNKTSFAFFGTDHCYKTENKKGVNWIASLIKDRHIEIKQNSTIILYKKSRFMRHKSMFPKSARFFFKKIDTKFISHRFQNEPFKGLKHKKYLEKHKISNLTMWNINKLKKEWNFVTNRIKDKSTIDYFDNVILINKSNNCTPYY